MSRDTDKFPASKSKSSAVASCTSPECGTPTASPSRFESSAKGFRCFTCWPRSGLLGSVLAVVPRELIDLDEESSPLAMACNV